MQHIKYTKLIAICISILITLIIVLPLAKYQNTYSSYYDMGLFQNGFYKYHLPNQQYQWVYGHINILFPLWAELYAVFPRDIAMQFIILAQSLTLTLCGLILWKKFTPVVGLLYFLYSPVWYNALFDFHFDHLAVPIMLAFYLAVESKRLKFAVALPILLMMIKEPFALEGIGCGVFIAWAGTKNNLGRAWTFAGVFVAVFSACYLYMAMNYVLPYFSAGEGPLTNNQAFPWLNFDLIKVISGLKDNPVEFISNLVGLKIGKIYYVLVLFGSLAFIPILKPVYLLPALPLLAIALLSHLPNHYDFHAHYTAGLIIPLFFSFGYGLNTGIKYIDSIAQNYKISTSRISMKINEIKSDKSLNRIYIYLIIIFFSSVSHVIFGPSPFGRLFWSSSTTTYNWNNYIPDARSIKNKNALDNYIPDNPNIIISTQNNIHWVRLANRTTVLPFPYGVTKSYKAVDLEEKSWLGFYNYIDSGYYESYFSEISRVDYVILDLRRPLFYFDQGCNLYVGRCLDKKIEEEFFKSYQFTKLNFKILYENDGFFIYERKI